MREELSGNAFGCQNYQSIESAGGGSLNILFVLLLDEESQYRPNKAIF